MGLGEIIQRNKKELKTMSIESHFNNIKKEILQNIKSAEKSIFGAIAWLTDKELMNVLYTKAIKGIKIDLIMSIGSNHHFLGPCPSQK